jgi:hypothetical protein
MNSFCRKNYTERPRQLIINIGLFLFALTLSVGFIQVPNININKDYHQLGESAKQDNYDTGCLTIVKYVSWSPAISDPDYSFEICIRGPSYPGGSEYGACQTVESSGGELTWYALDPGDYLVMEANPENLWEITLPPGPIWVPADLECSQAEVINVYNRGILTVWKDVNWNGMTPEESKKFWICLRGPSFPTGQEYGSCQPANYSGGYLQWEILPGNYTIRELDPGSEWDILISPENVYVPRGEYVWDPTVTNTRKLIGFQLLTPNGYEVLAAGLPWIIRWNTFGNLPNVKLEYSTDDFWNAVIITGNTANAGTHLWTLPPDPKENLRVRILDPGGIGQSDASDQPFRSVIMNEHNELPCISR